MKQGDIFMYESSVCLFGKRKNNERRAYIEITNTCNMHCKHCMNNSGETLVQGLKKEQMIDLLAELHEQSINQLYISGGEPLLYNGIDDVLHCASSYGMKITLATNGTELENHLSVIKSCVDKISMSLDGIGETHDFFRGVPGSFDHLLNMMSLLKKQRIKTKISTIIWKQNIAELDDIVTLVKSMGMMKINFNILVPVGRANANMDIHIPITEYHDIYKKINKLIEKYNDELFTVEIKRNQQLNTNSMACPGGKSIVHINANGKVSPCSWLSKLDNENKFSLYWEKGNFEACFNECKKIDNILAKRVSNYGFSGCPALAKIYNGDLLSQDPLNKMM